MFNKLKNEDVFNVFINMFGTVVSQIIPIAFMPILTRLYSPTDFGVFSIYVALAAIGAVIAAGRYEMAILLPKNSIEAFNLLGLSVLISSLMALFFLIIAVFFHRSVTSLIGNPLIEGWLFLIPVSILFNGILQASIYWNIRYKRFSTISTAKVIQGLSGTGLQLLLSIQKTVQLGLILGYVLGLITSTSMLVKSICTNSKQLLHCLSLKRMMVLLLKYRKFPLYSLWGALLDTTALQMPIFMISKFYSAEMTGFFSLTFRTLNLPIVLIATAVAQVLFQKVTHLNNYKPELLYHVLLKTFFTLIAISLPILLIVFYWGADLYSFIFGKEWTASGTYASLIVFAIVMRFSVSPLSSVMIIEKNLKLGFFWQLTYFITISITLYIAAKYPISVFIRAFVLHEIILYLFYLYLILKSTKDVVVNARQDELSQMREAC